MLLVMVGCTSQPSNVDNNCGFISAYLKPPKSAQLYRALVTHIDGKPVVSQPNYRLRPGSYELTVVELVHAPGMDVSVFSRKAKQYKVELKAGQRQHLAAKYVAGVQDEDFWHPEIWQIEQAVCVLTE